MRLGSWVPESNTYFSSLWRIDINQPVVEDILAWRLSYTGTHRSWNILYG